MPKYEVCAINRQYVRDWLRQNSLKATEASGMLGKNRNYVTNILCRADEGVTETVIDQFCSLGMSKVALLNQNSTVETSSGKVLEKPTVDEEEIKKKLFQQKQFDRDPAVEKAARAVDENGERLPFEKRMELLRGTDELTRVYRARDEERKELMECLREQEDRPADIRKKEETRYKAAFKQLVSDIMDIFAADPANFNMGILNSIQSVSKTYNVRLL